MGPEESLYLRETMSDTPPPSPSLHNCSPAASTCSVVSSSPISPLRSEVVTFRSPATRHLAHLDPWRRHSWEPGAVVQGNPAYDTRSVSLEDLDPQEMALVMGGALGCRKAREARRSVTREGSLSSLTEEETGTETQQQLRSSLEEQASQMHGCSASAPSLCVMRSTSKSSAPRPRSYCYDTVLYYHSGGSTNSLDHELSWEAGGEISPKREEGREETGDSAIVRTISFLRKMASNRKVSSTPLIRLFLQEIT